MTFYVLMIVHDFAETRLHGSWVRGNRVNFSIVKYEILYPGDLNLYSGCLGRKCTLQVHQVWRKRKRLCMETLSTLGGQRENPGVSGSILVVSDPQDTEKCMHM